MHRAVPAVALVLLSTRSLPGAAQARAVPSDPELAALETRLDSASRRRPFDYQAYRALIDSQRPTLWRAIEQDRLHGAEDFLAASKMAFDPLGFFENRRVEHELALAAFVLDEPRAMKRLGLTWDGLNLSIGRGQRLGSYKVDGTATNMDPVPVPPIVRAVFEDPQGARTRSAARANDPELERLRAADQADREEPIDAAKMARMRVEDPKRRARVLELLASGRAATGRDLHNAATVLQHGEGVDDFRLAHELAIAAFALGDTASRWLIARSYDRLLLHLGHRQRLATQLYGDGQLRPIDTTAMNDRLRTLLGGRALARAGVRP